MQVQIVLRNTGYNADSSFYQVGTDGLDMDERIEHSYSLGWDEPIIVDGTCPKYSTMTLDVPEWLIEGLQHYHSTDADDDPEGNKRLALDSAARIVYGDTWYRNQQRRDLFEALRYLTLATKPGKFYLSLMAFFQDRGWLSSKQTHAVLNPPYRRH